MFLLKLHFGLEDLSETEVMVRLFGAFFCSLLIIATIFGNTLVILVLVRFHHMRTVTNILLASLATADIAVAVLVMPFLMIFDLIRSWPFGPIPCHFWISCDVMCCTSSILHLCAVAIDRFWAITRPLRYRSLVNKRRLFIGIVIIWFASALISFIPIFFGWYHDGSVSPDLLFLDEMTDCSLKVNKVYAVVSSMTSFYLPLPVMFYVYFRILLIAKAQVRGIRQLQVSLEQNGNLHGHNLEAVGAEIDHGGQKGSRGDSSSTGGSQHDHNSSQKKSVERSLRRRSRQLVTDTKAITTLGIVMGVFCASWLPFFLMYLVSPFCEDDCNLNYEWRSAITWLGYLNSSINPIIYSFTNKDFKTAFKRILCCSPNQSIYMDDTPHVSQHTDRSHHGHQRNGIDPEYASTASGILLNRDEGDRNKGKNGGQNDSLLHPSSLIGGKPIGKGIRKGNTGKFLTVAFEMSTPSLSRTSTSPQDVPICDKLTEDIATTEKEPIDEGNLVNNSNNDTLTDCKNT